MSGLSSLDAPEIRKIRINGYSLKSVRKKSHKIDQFYTCKIKTVVLIIYLFHDDNEAWGRWQSIGYHNICRQESQTKHLVNQVYRGKEQSTQPGVTVTPRLGLWPQVEQGVRNQQHRQEHADPRAHHQRDLSKCIDQQVKVQNQSGRWEIRQSSPYSKWQKKKNSLQPATLPAFVNEINHQCTEDKENE